MTQPNPSTNHVGVGELSKLIGNGIVQLAWYEGLGIRELKSALYRLYRRLSYNKPG